MKLATLLILIISSALASSAQQRPGRWLSDGKPTPDSDWSKASNGFGAQLIVVDDPKGFVELWNRPEFPNITTATKIHRKQQFGAFILFAGCKGGNDGHCNAVVSFKIEDPKGKVIAERPNQTVWNGEVLDPRTTYMGKAVLGIAFSAAEINGTYTIRALVQDKNAPATLELKSTVELK